MDEIVSPDKCRKGNLDSIGTKAPNKDSPQNKNQRDVGAVADYNLKTLPHLRYMKYYKVSKQLSQILKIHIRMDLDIHSVEVGGEGDCFYHSVAAGLETLLLHSEEAKRHVLEKLPHGIFLAIRRK